MQATRVFLGARLILCGAALILTNPIWGEQGDPGRSRPTPSPASTAAPSVSATPQLVTLDTCLTKVLTPEQKIYCCTKYEEMKPRCS